MGFMQGFGSAFANTFSNTVSQAQQEKHDVFRMTYADYLDRSKEQEKYKREDSLAIRKAQEYEKMYDLPSGAWTQIYSWVKSGEDSSDIQKWIQKGQWIPQEEQGGPQAPQGPEGPQGVDRQMQQAGMAPQSSLPQAQQAQQSRQTQVAPEAPADKMAAFGGLLGNLSQKGKSGGKEAARRNQAMDRIARTTGQSRQQVDQVFAGYQEPTLPQAGVQFRMPEPEPEKDTFTDPRAAFIELAQAKTAAQTNPNERTIERYRQAEERVGALRDLMLFEAETEAKAKGLSPGGTLAGVWQNGEYKHHARVKENPDGSYSDMITGETVEGQVVPVDKTENEARDTLWKSAEKPLADIRAKADNAKASVISASLMADMVKSTEGEVLKPVTSGVFQWADRNIRDAATFAEKVNRAFSDTKEGSEVKVDGEAPSYERLIQTQEWLKTMDPNDLGTRKALFETQKAIMAYRIGMAMGQEGRGLAETERKMFMEMASSGVGVDQFYQGMSNLLVPMAISVDDESNSFLSSASQRFKDDYGYVPNFMRQESLIDSLSNDPNTASMWNEIYSMSRVGQPVERPTYETGLGPAVGLGANPDVPQAQDEIPTVATKEEAMQLPSGTVFRSPDGKIRRVP